MQQYTAKVEIQGSKCAAHCCCFLTNQGGRDSQAQKCKSWFVGSRKLVLAQKNSGGLALPSPPPLLLCIPEPRSSCCCSNQASPPAGHASGECAAEGGCQLGATAGTGLACVVPSGCVCAAVPLLLFSRLTADVSLLRKDSSETRSGPEGDLRREGGARRQGGTLNQQRWQPQDCM